MKRDRLILLLLAVSCFFSGFSSDKNTPPALLEIFEAERAFARTCGEKGIRASFTEFFADEGVAFLPQPVKYKEAAKNRPAPQNPLAVLLEWEPIFGDVAAAGDLGYDTGPSTLTDKTDSSSSPQHGFFFSVWKKQPDGSWKVVLDIGTDTGTPYMGSREARYSRPPAPKTTSKVNVKDEHAALMAVEHAFSKTSEQEGLAKAYRQHLGAEARLHRDGMLPLTDHVEILAYVAKNNSYLTHHPAFAEVSRLGDLAYTYGSYASSAANSQMASGENGFFTHVWKKDQSNNWKLVADITKAAVTEQE